MLQGARRITFKDFEKALEAIAAEKKLPVAEVQRRIVASGGPKRTGTTPTNHVRLHDDKSTFTGATAEPPGLRTYCTRALFDWAMIARQML